MNFWAISKSGKTVDSQQDIDRKKATLTLSKETIEDLTITGKICICIHRNTKVIFFIYFTVKSFVEVTRYLTTLPDTTGQYFLSERISQDPLENYFGRVCARGGQCKNPTAKDCLVSAQSLCPRIICNAAYKRQQYRIMRSCLY